MIRQTPVYTLLTKFYSPTPGGGSAVKPVKKLAFQVVQIGTNTQVGQSNKLWKIQVAAGLDATTDYSADYINYSQRPAFQYAQQKMINKTAPFDIAWSWNWTSSYAAYSDFPGAPSAMNRNTSEESKLRSRAAAKFNTRAKQVVTEFGGVMFLGELAETLRMIRTPMAGLVRHVDDYLDNVKRYMYYAKRRLTPQQIERDLNDLYLSFAYGWKPFLMDMHDAVDAFERFMIKSPRPVHVSVSKKSKVAGSITRGTDLWLCVRVSYTN